MPSPTHRAAHHPARRAARGFTLIEMLVVFALVAVMLALAAPGFVGFQRNAQLTSTSNAVVAALSAARAEAMKRQLRAFVLPVSDDWAKGWIVYVDVDNDLAYTAGTDVLVSSQAAMPSTVTVTINGDATGFKDNVSASTLASKKYAMFNGSGFMTRPGAAFLAEDSVLELTNGTESRRIIANPAGRLRVCKPTDAGCTGSAL